MTKIIFCVIVVLFSYLNIHSQNDAQFQIDAPSDWKKETIKFPLDFAPDIIHQGFEELRFAPGMFNPKSDSYFSYTFFWWLKGKQNFTKESLEDNLEKYFKGLCKEVGNSRKLKIDLNKINARVMDYKQNGLQGKSFNNIYHAKIDMFDPFNKGEELLLNMEIAVLDNRDQNKTIITFCASPKSFEEPIWKQLREIRDSLQIK